MVLDLKIAQLPQLLRAPLCGVSFDSLDRQVELVFDSRQVKKGSVFWALKGEKFDGHTFATQALQQGAEAVVVDQSVVEKNPKALSAYIPVHNTNEALLQFASRYSELFSACKIGITGSNGKTTTKEMINAILSKKWSGWATEGNFNNHIGVPFTLLGIKKNYRYAVVEMGTNHPGEIAQLTRAVQPDIALITTIGDSHLEFFHNRDNVFKEKFTIVQGLKQEGWLVVNRDDPFLAKIKPSRKYQLLTYGVESGDVSPKKLEWDEKGCAHFTVGRSEFALSVPGRHSLSNALAAIAVAQILNVPKKMMVETLKQFQGSAMRMQIQTIQKRRVVLDCYNANPSSMAMAVETVGKMKTRGRRIAILGDMLELGSRSQELHREIGPLIVENHFDLLITIGKEAEEIGRSALTHGFSKKCWVHYPDILSSASKIVSQTESNDLLLVKASRGIGLERLIPVLKEGKTR